MTKELEKILIDNPICEITLKIPCPYCVINGTKVTTDIVAYHKIAFFGDIKPNKQMTYIGNCPDCGKPLYVQVLGRFNYNNNCHLQLGQTYYAVFYEQNNELQFYIFNSNSIKTIPWFWGKAKINEKGEVELFSPPDFHKYSLLGEKKDD